MGTRNRSAAAPRAHAVPAQAAHGNERFDAAHALRGTLRTAPWMTIAISAHVLAGAIFAIVHFASEAREEVAPLFTISANVSSLEEVAPPEEDVREPFDRTAIPDEPVELVDEAVPMITDPELLASADLRVERGDPTAVDMPAGSPGGSPIGVDGPGRRGLGVPSAFLTLRPGFNPGRGKPGSPGGDPYAVTNEAVLKGLIWLARHQDPSGAWLAPSFMQQCPADHPCQPETALEPGRYTAEADVGLTSLALLCYLGAGLGHNAKPNFVDTVNSRRIFIGRDVVKPGLQWLVDHQNADGSFSSGRYLLYNEALAALALSEAYGLTRAGYWKEPAQRAIDFLCRAQKRDPRDPDALWGWRYEPYEAVRSAAETPAEVSDADMSVTGWMVMALKSAQLSGLEVPQRSLDGALRFTRWCTGRNGLVGYVGPDGAGQPVFGDHDEYAYHVGTMSSIGMCVRIFLEGDRRDPFLAEAAEVLLRDLPRVGTDSKRPEIDYYYWYYGSLALNQIDGPDAPGHTNRYWGPWNKAMTETLLALQDRTDGACTSGGWMAPDRWSYGFGPVYTTAINVLSLEVYYRYANAFGMKQEGDSASKGAPVRAGVDGPEDR
jgi:hypothetical protein